MFKNWPAICAVRCVFTKIALSLGTDERLQIAFPECFSETEVTPKIPIGVMMEVAAQQSDERGDTSNLGKKHFEMDVNFDWNLGACKAMGIPVLYRFNDDSGLAVPDEIRAQFQRGILQAGFQVEYKDQRFVLVSINDEMHEWLNKELTPEAAKAISDVGLSPAECFCV